MIAFLAQLTGGAGDEALVAFVLGVTPLVVCALAHGDGAGRVGPCRPQRGMRGDRSCRDRAVAADLDSCAGRWLLIIGLLLCCLLS